MQWEYKTVKLEAQGWFVGGKVDTHSLNRLLNEYGHQGWEVITAVDTNTSSGQTRDILVIMKRPSP